MSNRIDRFTPPRPQTVTDPPTYTVDAFCKTHHISRAYLYQLWSEGRGTRHTKLGRRTLITGEAAATWRRQIEQETPPCPAAATSSH